MRHAAHALAALLLASACGDNLADVAADGSTAWPEERSFQLPSGVLVEAELAMHSGDSVDVEYVSGGGPVVWDIHSHDGDQIITERQGRDDEGAFTFVAPMDATYWSLWLNEEPAVLELNVVFRGHGSTEFRGWL